MKNNEELLKNNERQNIDEVKPAEQILISRLSNEKKKIYWTHAGLPIR